LKIISAEGQAALDSGNFKERLLVKVDVPGDPFLIWDDIGDITVAGETYAGHPGRFTFQSAPSSYDQAARGAKLTFSGLDPDVLALLESAPWHQAPVHVQIATIALDAPTLLNLTTEFIGFLDQINPRIAVNGTTTLEGLCETESREQSRSGAATRSDADQRTRDAVDGFFAASAAAINTTIDWGRAPERPQKQGGIGGFLSKIF
jgi:hypothetical protein